MLQQECVRCDCKVSTSELITADKLSVKTAAGGWGGNRSVNEGEALRAPEELELCPSSHTHHLSPGFPTIVL